WRTPSAAFHDSDESELSYKAAANSKKPLARWIPELYLLMVMKGILASTILWLFRVYMKGYSPQRRGVLAEIGVSLDQEIFYSAPSAPPRFAVWKPGDHNFIGSRSPDSIFQRLCAEESHIWCTGAVL